MGAQATGNEAALTQNMHASYSKLLKEVPFSSSLQTTIFTSKGKAYLSGELYAYKNQEGIGNQGPFQNRLKLTDQ
jgi:hypothetical protein